MNKLTARTDYISTGTELTTESQVEIANAQL